MAPRAPTLLSLMSSSAYPPLPTVDELEQLKQTLEAQSSNCSTRLSSLRAQGTSGNNVDDEHRKGKKDKKRKDRDDVDDRERAALAANQRAGAALEAVERRKMDIPNDSKVKHERVVSPAPSNASSASFRPGQSTYGGTHNKKKIKRVLDSDDEATPHHTPPHQTSTSGLKLKLAPGGHHKSRPQSHVDPSPTPSASTAQSAPGASIDWALPPPPSRPLVPTRPGVQAPMPPGPKRQSEVDEDYSDKKAPSQISIQTFWQNVEPYIRDLREDDLAMLNFKADTPESYNIPVRGRHYTEIWDEEDGNPIGTTPRFSVPNLRQQQQQLQANGTAAVPPVVHSVPTEMRDSNLVEENRGLGVMTERVVAAVIGGDDVAEEAKKDAGKTPEPPDNEAGREAAKVDVVELEDRVKKELRSVMLLGEHEEFDPNNREDDQVTSALRQCQRSLMQQAVINDARKAILAKIAKDRLAFNEYKSVLEEVEKQIESSWAKRIKKHGSGGKKVLQDGVISGQGRPPVPDSQKRLLSVRDRWLNTVGKTMKDRPTGEVTGLPTRSIFKGIGDDETNDDDGEQQESIDAGTQVAPGSQKLATVPLGGAPPVAITLSAEDMVKAEAMEVDEADAAEVDLGIVA